MSASDRAARGAARTSRVIALAAFLLVAATGGGRIVGSDEVTMLELSRSLAGGTLAVPEGATLRGPDGRDFTKNAAAQAIAALPIVAASDAVAGALGWSAAKRELAARAGASMFNALVVAILLAAFYRAARRFGVGANGALAGTVLLGFTTPLWVYAKSFMAEPMQALGLLLALSGAAFADDARWRRAGAIGVFLAVSTKLSMLPFALLALLPLRAQPPGRWLPFGLGLALALGAHAAYNVARFGTVFETGYGAQASLVAYTTPLWVGAYGLLISSGKGVLWFAPALWLVPLAWSRLHRPHEESKHQPSRFQRALRGIARWFPGLVRGKDSEAVVEHRFDDLRRAAHSVGWMWAVAIVLYGTFEHWAGDGSFGPRYLVPLLPPAFLLVAYALQHPSRARRRAATVLACVGLLVQIGGVSIHFGAQMREAGDYPYTRALADPGFMSDSHFNPAYTPILGHWRMLVRNAAEHLRGETPKLGITSGAAFEHGAGAPDSTTNASPTSAPGANPSGPGRVGVSAADQARLLHALDFWWLYAAYAGLPGLPLQAVAALLAAFGLAAAVRARRLAAAED